MKIKKRYSILNKGSFSCSEENKKIQSDIEKGIEKVVHPKGGKEFILYRESKGNGVTPIKKPFKNHLKKCNWEDETPLSIFNNQKQSGPLDFTYDLKKGKLYAVEWETGNISSSYRALIKILGGFAAGEISGATLIVPMRETAKYLTDRVSNYEELEPYFIALKSISDLLVKNSENAFFEIIGIVHDRLTTDESYRIPKGKDGNAKTNKI